MVEIVHLSPPWQPWHLPSWKSWRPAATLLASTFAARGERIVCTYDLMPSQSVRTPGVPSSSGLPVADTFAAEPLSPPFPLPFDVPVLHGAFAAEHAVAMSIRSLV